MVVLTQADALIPEFRFGRNQAARARLYAPINTLGQHYVYDDMPVLVWYEGNGWQPAHFWERDVTGAPINTLIEPITSLLKAGFAVVFAGYPYGTTVGKSIQHGGSDQFDASSQRFPSGTFTEIHTVMAQCIQYLKDNPTIDGQIVGGSLSTNWKHYITGGNSAGAISALYNALQPSGTYPFYKDYSPANAEWTYASDHRVRGVWGLFPNLDFYRINPTSLAYSAVRSVMGRRWATGTIPRALQKRTSVFPHIERNLAENREVGMFLNYTNDLLGSPTTTKTDALAKWDADGPITEQLNVHDPVNCAAAEREVRNQEAAINIAPEDSLSEFYWGLNTTQNPGGNLGFTDMNTEGAAVGTATVAWVTKLGIPTQAA